MLPFGARVCTHMQTDVLCVVWCCVMLLQALWTGFPFKAAHLGGSGALLAMLIPVFKNLMGVTQE